MAIVLEGELEQALRQLAEQRGQEISACLREMIDEQLAEAEDARVALQRLNTPGQRWSLEALEQGLDLEH